MINVDSILDPVRNTWENFNERERRLLSIFGSILLASMLLLPLYLANQSVASIEEENQAIRKALLDMQEKGGELAKRRAERQATENRLSRAMPPLGSFIDEKARAAGIKLSSLNDEPDQTQNNFIKKSVRIKLDKVGLRELIKLMTLVETSNLPVAIDFLRVEHYQSGDSYNIDLGVVGYEKRK